MPKDTAKTIPQNPESEETTAQDILRYLGAGTLAGVGATLAGVSYLSQLSTQNSLVFKNKTNFAGDDLSLLQEPDQYEILRKKKIYSTELDFSKTKDEEENKAVVWLTQIDKNKPTLVFFPGNGGHLGESPEKGPGGMILGEGTDAYLKIITEAIDKGYNGKGYNVVAVNYPGYGDGSKIEPTQEKLFACAEGTIDWLVNAVKIPPEKLHLAGLSMGTTIAAHAANYLADTEKFKEQETNKINLVLVNGNISVPEAIRDMLGGAAGSLASSVWRDDTKLDTGKELEELADKVGKRGNVTFLRGADDPATHARQLDLHGRAAALMNFRGEEIEGARHYPPASEILRQFDEMSKGNFEIIKLSDETQQLIQRARDIESKGRGH